MATPKLKKRIPNIFRNKSLEQGREEGDERATTRAIEADRIAQESGEPFMTVYERLREEEKQLV